MAADVSKQLERAKKFLEKNRVEDAIEAYLAVLDGSPQHLEASQALGDLYTRLEQPDRAAVYYGHLFDLLIDPKDETKALAIYNRFLRKSRIAVKRPSSNTQKRRRCSPKPDAGKMRCSAGNAPRNWTRRNFRVR